MDIFEILEKMGVVLTEQQKIQLQQQMEQHYYPAEKYQQDMAQQQFDYRLENAIGKAKGRSSKAIRAMLDVDALRSSQQPEQDIKAALEQLKRENGYLFEAEVVLPMYAGGTGTGTMPRQDAVLRAAFGLEKR